MFVYVITNKINGKRYVGQTCLSVDKRWSIHVRESGYEHRRGSPVFHKAIRKYGAGSFVVETAISVDSQAELDFAERWFIDELGSLQPSGYNVALGGFGGFHSEETKQKIGLAHRGMKRSPESKERMGAWQRGRKHSPEAREKIRLSLIGHTLSPESRAKLSASKMGTPSPFKGCKRGPMSEATKEKLRIAKANPTFTDEHRAKISAGLRGLWQSPEYRQKVLEARRLRREVAVDG